MGEHNQAITLDKTKVRNVNITDMRLVSLPCLSSVSLSRLLCSVFVSHFHFSCIRIAHDPNELFEGVLHSAWCIVTTVCENKTLTQIK